MKAGKYRVRRGMLVMVTGVGIAAFGVAATLSLLPSAHVTAIGVPHKDCSAGGSGSGGSAQPGDTISCAVFEGGALLAGESLVVTPTNPMGAVVAPAGCTGFSGGQAPFLYTTTAVYSSAGNGSCTFTLVGNPSPVLGDSQLGTESIKLPAGTQNVGQSVTQTAAICPSANNCGPPGPMGVSGTASCIGGPAVPGIGGCAPSAPSGGTPTPSSSGGGGGNNNGGGGNAGNGGSNNTTGTTTGNNGQVKAAATSSPFTGGPEHPFPVAATGIAAGGSLLLIAALVAPMWLRRRRSAHSADS